MNAQTKTELEKQKKFLLSEIKNKKSLLDETKKNKKDRLQELNLIDQRIVVRRKLLSNLQQEIKLLNLKIDTTTVSIKNLEEESINLKNNYAKMIRGAYKTRNSNSIWYFVFSADNFNEALKRYKYLSQYSDYRKEQLNIIEANKIKLSEAKQNLSSKLSAIQNTRNEEKNQTQKLQNEKQSKDLLVKELASEEKKIFATIEKNKKESGNLSKKISEIIAKEIAAAVAKTKAKAEKNKSSKSKTYELTPAAKLLSKNFSKNKGKLPWPVESGFISEKFGKHRHKYLKRVQTENKGINIATKKGSKVKSVFNGEVVNVFKMPLMQTTIIISHGDYFTVYANIAESNLKAGQKIKTNQTIGTVYTNTKNKKTEVHLEIWKGQTNLNPTYWLSKK